MEVVPFSDSGPAKTCINAQPMYREQHWSLALLGACKTRRIWSLYCLALVNQLLAVVENASHFSELHQEKYNEMPLIISCKASISVVFLECGYKYFFKFQRNNLQDLTCKSELLKSCAVKSFTYDW